MKESTSTRKSVKLISVLLTLATLIVSLPLTVFAQQNEPVEQIVQELPALEQNDVPEQLNYEELVEQGYIQRLYNEEQDLYSYLFGNEDGTKTRFYYQYPVKYIDENGIIRDKSLGIVSKFVNGVERFVSRDSDIAVTFHNSLAQGVELAYKELSLSMIPETTGLTLLPMLADLSDDGKSVRYTLDEATYIDYSLTHTGIKEDIVVTEYTGRTSYSFLLSTGGLSVAQNEYGEYVLVDNNEEVQASLGDVLIFTADERNNTFGSMRVEQLKKDHLYRLIIEVDADWLADEKTVYPITIDPTISITVANTTYGTIEDCVIGSNPDATYNFTSGSIYVGKGSTGSIIRGVMRFPDLDLRGKIITSAAVEIRDLMCQGQSTQIECREYIGNSWSSNNAPTWSNVGSNMVGKLLDSHFVCYGNGNVIGQIQRYSYDITELAKDWAAGTADPAQGIIFKAVDSFENDSTNTFKTFASIDHSQHQPSLSVTYSDAIGLNTSYEYDTQTLGDSVTIYNNIQFGGLVAEIKLDIPESLFPIQPSYVYNSALSSEEFFTYYGLSNAISTQFLPGWKINLVEAIVQQGSGYYYIDGYNTEYYLTYDAVQEKYVLDEIGAVLTVNSDGYTLELDDGMTRQFNSNGVLSSLTYDKKTYTYVYSNNRLSEITCNNETVFTFTYDNDGFRGITYTIDGSTIWLGRGQASDLRIYDQYGNVTNISISGTEFNIYNALDGYGYRYTLSGEKVTEYEYYRNVGSTEYLISSTVITRNGNRITYTTDDIMTTYLLNAYNQLYNVIVSSTDGKTVYDAQMYSYEETEDEEATYTRGGAHNLFLSTFSEFNTNWSGTFATSNTKALMGSHSVVLSSTNGSKKNISQVVNLSAGNYVLSVYVQYSDLQRVNSQLAGGFYINVMNTYNEIVCNGEYYLDSLTDTEDEWVRVWIPCTIETTDTYIVSFILDNAIGTVYLDCFQLEKGIVPTTYNCVQNAGFETSEHWNNNYTQIESDSMFGDYVAVAGKSTYQNFDLDDMPNTRSFIISGWLYCTGGGADNFELFIRLKDSNSYYIRLPFENIEGLQYISYEITFPSSCETLDGMEIILYGTAASDTTVAYFDNILFTLGSPIAGEETEETYSSGLNFVSNDDGTCYLGGIGTCTDTTIVVPPTSPAGERVTKVGVNAFKSNTDIKSIVLPDTVEIVAHYAFRDCTFLKSVVLGDGVIELQDRAFSGCTALEEINFPDTLTTIGLYCFDTCQSLKTVELPDSVTSLKEGAFLRCASLESLTLSNGITELYGNTIRECTSLVSVVLPENLTTLSSYCFLGCTKLQSVQIPETLTTVRTEVFENCTSHMTFYCTGDSSVWDGITFGTGALPPSYETQFHSELIGNFVYKYTYDSKGNIVGTEIHYIGYAEDTANTDAVMFTSVVYDAMGNLLSYTDESGHTTTYTYDIYGNVLTVTDATNITTTYTYYSNGLLKSVSRAGQTNTYTYSNGLLSVVTHTGTGYSQYYAYSYNNYGNLTSVRAGGQTLVSYAYENGGRGDLLSITYANGDVKSYAYDIFGNMTEVRMNGALQASYLYDYSGSLYAHTETVIGETTRYFEDEYGYAGYALTFDSNGQQVAAIPEPSVEISIDTTVDVFDRVTGKALSIAGIEEPVYTQTYKYPEDAEYYSSYEIKSEEFSGGTKFVYEYNDLGYLTSVKEYDTLKLRYTYDDLGQLTREDNAYSGKTYFYTYDNGGNILMKQTYAYTTEEYPGTLQSRLHYGYGNSNWKDQLTSYDGTSITYDLSGNPLKWRNASAMNWTGRQLDSMTLTNGTTLSFLYNSDGLRVSKTVGNNTVKYRWDGATLLAEEHATYTLTFLYDGDTLIGFNYGGNNYYYGIDNLGVIHYVYNEAGTVVVTYTYDAWGNTISASGNSTLISVNPIRYKSYYYDSETGLFYLQSRYYDPVVGRFISADDTMYTGITGSLLSYNLYAYCENNPINNCDPWGTIKIRSLVISLAIDGIILWLAGHFQVTWLGYMAPLKALSGKLAQVYFLRYIAPALRSIAHTVAKIASKALIWIGKKALAGMINVGITGAISGLINEPLRAISAIVSVGGLFAALADIISDKKFDGWIRI
jgi:RHS repeat-associated protein